MSAPVKLNCRNCKAKLDLSDCRPFDMVACPQCGTALRVPQIFDRYLLEKLCGKGGDSLVYRALEPDLARRVAVKVESESGNRDTAERFVNSARISGKVNHPGVVQVFHCGTFEERAFMVMRYMEHGDLERMMKQKKLPGYLVILEWILAVVETLMAAGKNNIVHHDIKPANIMLTANDEVKLGDWDIADIREPGDRQTPCTMWASPIYTSPERIFGGGEDYKGDIFSLGVTLYELLSGGEAPFGLHGDTDTIYKRRKEMNFRSLALLNPEVPPAIALLVNAMLDFQPENRPEYGDIQALISVVIAGKRRVLQKQKNIKENNDL